MKKRPPLKLLDASTREEWRAWLAGHYRTEREIWLVFPKAHTGRPRIPYNDAVEEALSFGWIDSTARKLDEDRFAQRFTPRRPGSTYSEANKARLRALVRQGKVAPDVLTNLVGALKEEPLRISRDIRAAIEDDRGARHNFRAFPEAYKRIRIAYIEGARNRPAEFAKRLRHFVEMTRQNKMFGFGGIEKHYQNK